MKGLFRVVLVTILFTASCESDPYFDTIPPTSFDDIFINLCQP